MNKRKNEELNQYLLNEEEFKIFINLQQKLEKILEYLNHLYELKQIKYTIIVLKASQKSITETKSFIRKTDFFFKIPFTVNHYIIILQNTECKSAIEFGSRLTSLINRLFLLKKKNISHKISIISFKTKPPSLVEVCYEILFIMKKLAITDDNIYWSEIKRV